MDNEFAPSQYIKNYLTVFAVTLEKLYFMKSLIWGVNASIIGDRTNFAFYCDN